MLSLKTKPSIGGAYGLLYFVCLLSQGWRWQALAGYIIGVTCIFFLINAFIESAHSLEQTLEYNIQMAQRRLHRLGVLKNWFVNFYWIPLLVVIGNVLVVRQKFSSLLVLFIGMYFLNIFSILSGGIIWQANIFLWGIFTALAFLVIYSFKETYSKDWQRYLWKISNGFLFFMTVGLIVISARDGYHLKVWSYISVNPIGDYAIKTEPLKGWRSNPYQGMVLDESVKFLKSHMDDDDTLLVVTDMQILYALTGRDSYRGIQLIVFQKDHAPVPGQQVQEVKKKIQANLPDWIVTDAGGYIEIMPYIGMAETIREKYEVAKNMGHYAILVKR